MNAPAPVPEALLAFIREGSNFIVAGHREPDGDCVGSQLSLASALSRLGKNAAACTAGPFSRSEVRCFENEFSPLPPDLKTADYRVILVDCSEMDRIGDIDLAGLPVAAVDHHAAGKVAGDVVYLDSAAPSVTSMVLRIIKALGLEVTAREAELLLFGLCTDTGFFRHLTEAGGTTFLTAAELCAAGASPKKVFFLINGGKTLPSRRLTGRVLNRTKSFYGGRLLVSTEYAADEKEYDGESRDSDMIYQMLMSIDQTEAVMLIREEKPKTSGKSGNCVIGLRSRDRIDVGAVAAAFGGGGHKNASGASIPGTPDQIEEKLVAAFKPFFVPT